METRKTTSLKQVMDDVLQRMLAVQSGETDGLSLPLLTETDAYSALDPVLNDLRRQYLAAEAQCTQLVELRGEDDPLAEAAYDWQDSTESAIETRLIELRRDNEISKAAMLLTKKEHEKIEEEKKRATLAYKKRLREFDLMCAAENLEKEGKDSFISMIMLLMMLGKAVERTRKILSIASAFSKASMGNSEHVVYS